MFEVGEQIPSGARQMKLPLILPPIDAHPPREMKHAPATRPKLRISSAPSVADFENLSAPRPNGSQRHRSTRHAGEQDHANRQSLEKREHESKPRSEEHTSELQSLMRISY